MNEQLLLCHSQIDLFSGYSEYFDWFEFDMGARCDTIFAFECGRAEM